MPNEPFLPPTPSSPTSAEDKDEDEVVKHGVISSGSTTEGDHEPETQPNLAAEKAAGADVGTVEAKPESEPEYEYITGVKSFAVIAAVTLIAFLMLLDVSIIVTAVPRITSDFHSLDDVGWYGTSYLLASCALQPLTGKVYSNFSSKWTLLSFLAIFELGSALCGAARSSNMLIIARAIAGLGASGLMNGALTIIAATVPMHKRPAMMGIMMSIGQIGIVGGPLIGGAFTQYVTWRWCFYINLPIGAVAALFLIAINIPDRVDRTGPKATFKTMLSKLDIFGFVLFAPFATMLLLALEWGGTVHAWNSSIIIGLFCGGAGMLLVFLVWEYHVGDDAMIPFSMIKQRIVWSSCMTIFFFFGAMLTLTYYLPIYFQAVKGVSPALSGVYLLPGILSQMVFAITSGILVGKLGYYLPWIVASGAIQAVGNGLIATFEPDTSTAMWVGYQFIAGVGRGCGLQMPLVAIQNALPPDKIPVGMSIVVFFQIFGGAILLTFAQLIFSHSLVDGLHKFAPNVNPETVVTAGATAVRQAVKPDQLVGVLQAYNLAINREFYFAAGSSVAVFVFCWGMGWRSVKKKTVVTPEA